MSRDYRKDHLPVLLRGVKSLDTDHLPEVIVMEHSDIDGDGDDLCLLA